VKGKGSSCFGGGGDEATGKANQTKTGASSSKAERPESLGFQPQGKMKFYYELI